MPPKAKAAKGAKKAPKAHKLCDPLPVGTELNDMIKGKWRIGKPVGQGGFGLLYLASAAESSSKADPKYVIKVEPWSNGALFSELSFYQRVAKPDFIAQHMSSSKLQTLGMPKYIAAGSHEVNGDKMRFMVMERFGVDLQKKFIDCRKTFSRKTISIIALQLIDTLQYIHSKEYVHADIKAANLLLGYDKSSANQVYLVDYGLAFRYTVDGKHRVYKEDPRRCHDGTIEFTSIDAHKGVSPSRRGDMEILGYCLLQWACSRLPWEDKLQNCNYVRDQKIKYMKNVPSLMKACFSKGQIPDELQKYMTYVSRLDYSEAPDYSGCRKYFTDALKENGWKNDGKLDFSSSAAAATTSSTPKRKTKTAAASSKRKVVTSPQRAAAAHNISQTSFDSDSDVSPPKRGRRAGAVRSPSTSAAKPSTSTSPRQVTSPRRVTSPRQGARSTATATRGTKRSLSPSPALTNGRSPAPRSTNARATTSTPGTSQQPSAKKKPLRPKASVGCQTSPGLKGLKARRKK